MQCSSLCREAQARRLGKSEEMMPFVTGNQNTQNWENEYRWVDSGSRSFNNLLRIYPLRHSWVPGSLVSRMIDSFFLVGKIKVLVLDSKMDHCPPKAPPRAPGSECQQNEWAANNHLILGKKERASGRVGGLRQKLTHQKLAHLLDWLIRLVTCVMRWRILFIRNSPPELLPRKSVRACPVILPPFRPLPRESRGATRHVYSKRIFMGIRKHKEVIGLEFRKRGVGFFCCCCCFGYCAGCELESSIS